MGNLHTCTQDLQTKTWSSVSTWAINPRAITAKNDNSFYYGVNQVIRIEHYPISEYFQKLTFIVQMEPKY